MRNSYWLACVHTQRLLLISVLRQKYSVMNDEVQMETSTTSRFASQIIIFFFFSPKPSSLFMKAESRRSTEETVHHFL